ncbi:MAG: type II toxin-antitoxin system Phd/YefM family antitoxin [Selenomonadaceae bacterium]|nr:type II toxin-antitoxin system Phd/YefM family antitoxin [Selenomonadaceae bacterium]
MAQMIPIRDLKDTSAVSKLCREAQEPIYVTKNGCGDMVLMNIEVYEEQQTRLEIYEKLASAEQAVRDGAVHDAEDSLKRLREKYHV